jgi:hypothetical protein
MKILIAAIILTFISFEVHANDHRLFSSYKDSSTIKRLPDSVKLQVDGDHAYYQKVVKLDSNITVPIIYIRTLQFMASKNIQQTYGYEEEGKVIFSTIQDLNINRIYVGDENETVQPYSAQFSIMLDMKKARYRYTIDNIVFFLPTETGNKRETMNDVYLKETTTDSRRIAREAKNLITSFERYLTMLTGELYDNVEQKSAMYKSKF